jgi:hypothetical protein
LVAKPRASSESPHLDPSPVPDDDEVAALVVALSSLVVQSSVVETKPTSPSRWARMARREEVCRLGAAPRGEDGWRAGKTGAE